MKQIEIMPSFSLLKIYYGAGRSFIMEFGICPLCKLHRELSPHYSKDAGRIIEVCDGCYKTKLFMHDIP